MLKNTAKKIPGEEKLKMDTDMYMYGNGSDDPVNMYLKEISSIPLLTPEEERELAKRMAKGDEEAKNRLIESNLRLVVNIAGRYGKGSLKISC